MAALEVLGVLERLKRFLWNAWTNGFDLRGIKQLKYLRDASTIYETQPLHIYICMMYGVYLGIIIFG